MFFALLGHIDSKGCGKARISTICAPPPSPISGYPCHLRRRPISMWQMWSVAWSCWKPNLRTGGVCGIGMVKGGSMVFIVFVARNMMNYSCKMLEVLWTIVIWVMCTNLATVWGAQFVATCNCYSQFQHWFVFKFFRARTLLRSCWKNIPSPHSSWNITFGLDTWFHHP